MSSLRLELTNSVGHWLGSKLQGFIGFCPSPSSHRREVTSGGIPQVPFTLVFEIRSSCRLKLTDKAKHAGLWAPGLHLSPPSVESEGRTLMPGFCTRVLGSSCLHDKYFTDWAISLTAGRLFEYKENSTSEGPTIIKADPPLGFLWLIIWNFSSS